MEYHNGMHISGEMQVRDIGQWQVALWKSQRAIETSREQAIRRCWDTTKSIIVDEEPPYADPHVRWCERSENESRKKTFVFLLLDQRITACYLRLDTFKYGCVPATVLSLE